MQSISLPLFPKFSSRLPFLLIDVCLWFPDWFGGVDGSRAVCVRYSENGGLMRSALNPPFLELTRNVVQPAGISRNQQGRLGDAVELVRA